MSEADLQKWKIIDYIAVPIKCETRSTVARNCLARNLMDHWLVLTYMKLPRKKEKWQAAQWEFKFKGGGDRKQQVTNLALEE